jgi:hypothetical protein
MRSKCVILNQIDVATTSAQFRPISKDHGSSITGPGQVLFGKKLVVIITHLLVVL